MPGPSKDQVTALFVAAIGSLLAWSGIKGKSWTAGLKDLIGGQSPVAAAGTPINATSGTAGDRATESADPGGTAAIGNGKIYTEAQLKTLWQQAGGSAVSAQNAACHGMQESSGRATVTSTNPDGGVNVGLWQLDTKGVGAGFSVAQLQNPLTNARITVKATRNGLDWSQWATPGC